MDHRNAFRVNDWGWLRADYSDSWYCADHHHDLVLPSPTRCRVIDSEEGRGYGLTVLVLDAAGVPHRLPNVIPRLVTLAQAPPIDEEATWLIATLAR